MGDDDEFLNLLAYVIILSPSNLLLYYIRKNLLYLSYTTVLQGLAILMEIHTIFKLHGKIRIFFFNIGNLRR